MTVTEISNGGATCMGESGTKQRRHFDDIKIAPKNIEHTHIELKKGTQKKSKIQ